CRGISQSDEAVDRIGDGAGQISRVVIRVDGGQVLQRDADSPSSIDGQVQIAANGRRHIADVGAEAGADLHRELTVLHVSADLAGGADVDQIPDADVPLKRAIDVRILRPGPSAKPATLVNVHRLGRQLALDLAENLDLPAVANLAPDERVLCDD